jgi:tRNA-Thr(GGU) m(6)t(6)A37 methyltransferase TsaA
MQLQGEHAMNSPFTSIRVVRRPAWIAVTFFVGLAAGSAPAEPPQQPTNGQRPRFQLHPIGRVEKTDDRTRIVLDKKYQPALRGLDEYSHIYMFWWFDRNDTPEKRGILQVHPMGNRDNPLTGVFATRSPVRPNLIALTLCKLVSVEGNVVEIQRTDAFDGTPVLDIKPFIPGYDSTDKAELPEWLIQARKRRTAKPDGAANGHAGLHRVMRLSKRIYSGGEPHGQEAFASLAKMGVKTVVSVDAAKPDVESARRFGLRYVHIPIGYDGIPEEAGAALARVGKEVEGPVYIHCHHGRHRGPAAAAVACVASGAVEASEATAILEKAGTSKNYAGLWRDVRNYQPPAPDAARPELVETARVDSLAAAMAKVDRAFDNLELCREAGWRTPEEHPDLVPALQAFLVREGLNESAAALGDGYDAGFRAQLAAARESADRLGQAALDGKAARADTHFQALAQSCKQCHGDYRN